MNPLEGQDQEPQPPIEVDGQQEWEVQEILASRVINRTLQYRARWVGWDDDEQFYDAEGFKNCPHKLRQFHAANLQASGPPTRLEEWLQAWEDGELAPTYDNDNEPQRSTRRRVRRHGR